MAIGGQTSAPHYGLSGQTIHARLYVQHQVKQSGTVIADAKGAVVLPNLAAHLD